MNYMQVRESNKNEYHRRTKTRISLGSKWDYRFNRSHAAMLKAYVDHGELGRDALVFAARQSFRVDIWDTLSDFFTGLIAKFLQKIVEIFLDWLKDLKPQGNQLVELLSQATEDLKPI